MDINTFNEAAAVVAANFPAILAASGALSVAFGLFAAVQADNVREFRPARNQGVK